MSKRPPIDLLALTTEQAAPMAVRIPSHENHHSELKKIIDPK